MRRRVKGIYKITCLATGKIYIGSSINCLTRWPDHKRLLNKNSHGNPYLQAAWNKYGTDQFTFEIVEECGQEVKLLGCEQAWIDKLKTAKSKYGFNCMNPVKTRVPSRHMRAAHKAYWASLTPKQRKARTKHFGTKEFQERATAGKQSEEHKALKRKLAKKQWRSGEFEEHREALRDRFNGFKTNMVVRSKISAKAKARWLDPKYRERGLKQIREASRKRWGLSPA